MENTAPITLIVGSDSLIGGALMAHLQQAGELVVGTHLARGSSSKKSKELVKNSYIVVESYQNEREKFNLMCWVLTGECFFETREWEWLYKEFGYTGDYSFIYFE